MIREDQYEDAVVKPDDQPYFYIDFENMGVKQGLMRIAKTYETQYAKNLKINNVFKNEHFAGNALSRIVHTLSLYKES